MTNQLTKKFQEPRLLIVADPKSDRQAVIEASYVNIPTIALCNTDAPVDFIDVIIPCNNRVPKAIATVFWMLAREVIVLRGQLPVNNQWDVMIDLFIARDIETIRSQQEALRKEEEQEKGVQQDGQQAEVKAIQAGSEEDW